ncbi:MAG TPA: hypothetical protein VM580_09255 [Labilithrix sp.]|jgi:hypothetical protein|nr:hypothetical protein [Labilithrix sp.]
MLKRLVVGLVLGALLGGILAAVLVQGFGVLSFDQAALGAAGAYLAAGLTGVLTGLVTGKPIWSADGKIEAGLKAFFGALLALGGMFALRQWVHFEVDLAALKASNGPAEIGQLPAVSLPLLAAVLGGFFELDNTDAPEKDKKDDKVAGSKEVGSTKVRVSDGAEVDGSEDEESPPPAKARR